MCVVTVSLISEQTSVQEQHEFVVGRWSYVCLVMRSRSGFAIEAAVCVATKALTSAHENSNTSTFVLF